MSVTTTNLTVAFVTEILNEDQLDDLSQSNKCPSFGDAAYTLMEPEDFVDLVDRILNITVSVPRNADYVAFPG